MDCVRYARLSLSDAHLVLHLCCLTLSRQLCVWRVCDEVVATFGAEILIPHSLIPLHFPLACLLFSDAGTRSISSWAPVSHSHPTKNLTKVDPAVEPSASRCRTVLWWLEAHSTSRHECSPGVCCAFVRLPVAILSAALSFRLRIWWTYPWGVTCDFVFRTCTLLQLFYGVLETFLYALFCYVRTGFSFVGSYLSTII